MLCLLSARSSVQLVEDSEDRLFHNFVLIMDTPYTISSHHLKRQQNTYTILDGYMYLHVQANMTDANFITRLLHNNCY